MQLSERSPSLGTPRAIVEDRDVVTPYGEMGLARIADTSEGFVDAIASTFHDREGNWLARADSTLAEMSWDQTWSRISELLRAATIDGYAKTSAQRQLPAAANDR